MSSLETTYKSYKVSFGDLMHSSLVVLNSFMNRALLQLEFNRNRSVYEECL